MMSIRQAAKYAYQATNNFGEWESIVINKRKPHTYRAFIMVDDFRICLHRFEACTADDSFAHPHPWPSSMLVLSGTYDMQVGYSDDLDDGKPDPVIEVTLNAGSMYHMHQRQTWHKVIPRTQCFSLMVNGPRWEKPHRRAPSTGGKGLEAMSNDLLMAHLASCKSLLEKYLNTIES